MDWVAVTERYPHWTEWVAVKTDLDEYGEGFFHGPDVWLIESQWDLGGTITHWKPKPSGPDFGDAADDQSIPV